MSLSSRSQKDQLIQTESVSYADHDHMYKKTIGLYSNPSFVVHIQMLSVHTIVQLKKLSTYIVFEKKIVYREIKMDRPIFQQKIA